MPDMVARTTRRLIALGLGSAMWLAASAAQATDTWSDPFVGVKRLHRETGNQNINALVVDLCAPGIAMRATASNERGKKTSSFGSSVGAQAAINGDFFSYSSYSTDGVSAHGGATWGGSDHGYVGPIAFGEARAELYPHEAQGGPEPWMQEVVSGHPTVLWNGAPRDNNGDPLCTNRHPRTAVGLSQDRKKLILVVVDGRKPNRIGFTCDEESALLAELGAWDGMNLDGGGSSTMWVGGNVVSYPSDSSGERTVGNHLALYAGGSGPAVHCPIPDYRAKFAGAGDWPGGTDMTLMAGEEVTGWLDYENTGKKPWLPGVTKLGTTEPRDHAAAFAHESWQSPNRLAVLDHEVAPGEVARFTFAVRAPDTAGEYFEHFNLVQEAVTWFSDSGGPADDVSWLKVTSVALGEPPQGEFGGAAGSEGIDPATGESGSGGKQGASRTRLLEDDSEGCSFTGAPAKSVPWWLGLGLLSFGRRRSVLSDRSGSRAPAARPG